MGRKQKTVDLDRSQDIAPGLIAKTKKRLVVASGRSHAHLATEVATALGTELVPTEYRTFASGEILTRFEVSIRGCDFFLMQSFGPPVNEWLMETLIMLDAAKRASAKRITVVMPYFPYSRQDKKGRGREPISARLVADLLKTAGADRVMSVDLHAAQIQGFFDGPVDHLFAKPVLLVDDMIDTGGTILKAAEALKKNGAERVIVAATHPVFSHPATERLSGDAIDEVVVTDTIPLPEEKHFPTLTVLPIAPLLARAIREVFEDGSVTSMFDGAA